MTGRTEPPLERGTRIGPYEVDELVAKTRASRVVRATYPRTGKLVAVKVPTKNGVDRLVNEIIIHRRLRRARVSDHLLGVHSAGTWEGVPFLATPWQLNGTLYERLPAPPGDAGQHDATTPLPTPQDLQRNLRIIAGGIAGVVALNGAGFIHCDVKPSNVAVDDNHTGILFDFGVTVSAKNASHTDEKDEGIVFGSPNQSVPPEVYRGSDTASPARDVWAMGVTAFRALTGTNPFGEIYSWDPEGYDRVNRTPDITLGDFHPNAPSDLRRVVTKALNPDPKKRPSIDEMRDIFDQAASQDGIFER